MHPNTLLRDSDNGVVTIEAGSLDKAWAQAMDVVTYPVRIAKAYYKLYDDKDIFAAAEGESPQGRDKTYSLVLVDKLRMGDDGFKAIATVTDTYGTVDTAKVYEDLRQQLAELAVTHTIRSVYVSGNGGAQSLVVRMDDMKSVNTPDPIVMELRLRTSVDGTISHSISMTARNTTGDTSIYLYGGEYSLSARHTTTVGERSVEFIPQIKRMLENWNTVIIPTMNLMCDSKFDRKTAVEFVNRMTEEAGIGERHRDAIKTFYASDAVHTNDKSDSVYRASMAINEYIDHEMSDKPELQNKFKTAVAARIHKYVETKRLK